MKEVRDTESCSAPVHQRTLDPFRPTSTSSETHHGLGSGRAARSAREALGSLKKTDLHRFLHRQPFDAGRSFHVRNATTPSRPQGVHTYLNVLSAKFTLMHRRTPLSSPTFGQDGSSAPEDALEEARHTGQSGRLKHFFIDAITDVATTSELEHVKHEACHDSALIRAVISTPLRRTPTTSFRARLLF